VWTPEIPGWLLTVLLAAEAVATVGLGLSALFRWYRVSQTSRQDRLAILNHLLPPIHRPWYISTLRRVGYLSILAAVTLFSYLGLSIAVFVLTTPQGWYGPPWDANTIGLFIASEISFAVFLLATILLRPWTRALNRIEDGKRAERRFE